MMSTTSTPTRPWVGVGGAHMGHLLFRLSMVSILQHICAVMRGGGGAAGGDGGDAIDTMDIDKVMGSVVYQVYDTPFLAQF